MNGNKLNSGPKVLSPPPPPPPMLKVSKQIAVGGGQGARGSQSVATGDTIQQIREKRNSLNKTKTKVRTADGKVYEEEILETGHLSSEFKGLDVNSTIQQYTDEHGTPIRPHIYVSGALNWQPMEFACTHPTTTQSTSSAELIFVTFNVWFDSFIWKERANALFNILSSSRADVICLQEVTPTFLDYLKEQTWVKSNYALSDNGDLDTVYPYGVLLLTRSMRLAYQSLIVSPLPGTQQSRKVITGLFRLVDDGSIISISTAHLESLEQNSKARIEQLQFLQKQPTQILQKSLSIKEFNYSFLLGDFNFSSNSIENQFFNNNNQNFNDLWSVLNNISHTPSNSGNSQDEKGFTYIKKKIRVDRVLYKSNVNNTQSILKPISISIIGCDPIPICDTTRSSEKIPSHELIYPSDHFGLFCKFTLSSIINNNIKKK